MAPRQGLSLVEALVWWNSLTNEDRARLHAVYRGIRLTAPRPPKFSVTPEDLADFDKPVGGRIRDLIHDKVDQLNEPVHPQGSHLRPHQRGHQLVGARRGYRDPAPDALGEQELRRHRISVECPSCGQHVSCRLNPSQWIGPCDAQERRLTFTPRSLEANASRSGEVLDRRLEVGRGTRLCYSCGHRFTIIIFTPMERLSDGQTPK